MWNTSKVVGVVIAGAVGVSALTLTPDRLARAADEAAQPAAARTESDAEAVKPLALPSGIAAKDLNEDNDIRNAFAEIAEESFDDDIFDDVVMRLVDADRNRIGKFKRDQKPDFKPLRDRASALNKVWRDKYGKPFDIDEKQVYGEGGFLQIAAGEVSDPAQLAGNWPVAAVAAAESRTAGERQPADTAQQRRETEEVAGGDVNLEKGRNVAVVRFPASHGMPAIDASLIHELPDIWRFDLPDSVDGKRLHDNLLKHLNMLGDGSAWPADSKEAARMITHHVLLALYDIDEPAAKEAAAKEPGTGADKAAD